ncbi:NUDIX hydrolase [Sporosarcina sp. Sa2YVA2]|uniref:NUDIX hydrolase n=1 Tax=Sporosarcina quadrami TaxID=2762234 RepID=A0ABR8UEJ1_9BACL|nr:NUDIX hydrolase [Sporosarcina quadrami]MBD7986250.1 NUDIX hydrolase [Sporosarcina quadrami]
MNPINAYLQFCSNHPEYFTQDHDIRIIVNEETLVQFATERDCQLGLIYETKYFWVVIDLIENAQHHRYPYMRVIHKEPSNGVVIIPRLGDKVVFLRQFRHGTRQMELELPRGFAEAGCTVYENAEQEILEEIGASATNIELLGSMISDSALTYGPVHLLTCDISSIGKLENEEGIKDTLLLTKEEILEYIRDNTIRDGFSIAAIMKWILHS